MSQYKITATHLNERLDKFLLTKLKKFSRSQIQKNIKDGLILVNNKNVQPHYFLKETDLVEINKLATKKSKCFLSSPYEGGVSHPTTLAVNGAKVTVNNSPIGDIKIIYETKDFLVINKPAGILVHPDKVHNETTIADWLIKKYPTVKKVYDHESKIGQTRPGIVHRLDRDVSGLMVLAKTQAMFDHLKNQFKNRTMHKEYYGLVHGVVSLDEGKIERSILRSPKTGLMTATTDNQSGKEAVTEFIVVQRYKNYTLLKIKLLTGRTHQIRVHLKSIGHSLVGDKLYQTRDIRLKKNKSSKEKIFLYSAVLGFSDLDNNWQEFTLPTPVWWTDFLQSLKS